MEYIPQKQQLHPKSSRPKIKFTFLEFLNNLKQSYRLIFLIILIIPISYFGIRILNIVDTLIEKGEYDYMLTILSYIIPTILGYFAGAKKRGANSS